jgi:hypothetical protein
MTKEIVISKVIKKIHTALLDNYCPLHKIKLDSYKLDLEGITCINVSAYVSNVEERTRENIKDALYDIEDTYGIDINYKELKDEEDIEQFFDLIVYPDEIQEIN